MEYYYVTIITDPAGTVVESVNDKQKVGGSDPCLPSNSFSFFPGPLTGLD